MKPCRLILEAKRFYTHPKQCFLTHTNRPASPLGPFGSATLGRPCLGLGGECKGEDKPECPCLLLVYNLLSFLLFFSLSYGVQYLVVLTFVCYITPYIVLVALQRRCRFFGHCRVCARTDWCSEFAFIKLSFIIKGSDFSGCSVC